jgi:HAE1 family hydrophobic/amphiphilic exporter-1
MARAVIGGLITSTALTLLVIPVVYTYFDDLGSFVSRITRRGEKKAKAAPASKHARPATVPAEVGAMLEDAAGGAVTGD